MITLFRLRTMAKVLVCSAAEFRASVTLTSRFILNRYRPGHIAQFIVILLPTLVPSLSPFCLAQATNPVETALAGSVGAGSAGEWSLLSNPGARSDHPTLLVAMTTSSLTIGGEGVALLALPLDRRLGVNATLHGRGYGAWREVDGAAGLSAGFGRIDLGLRLHCNVVSIDRYGTSFRPSLDAGLLLPLDSSLMIGLSLRNVTGTTRLERRLRQSIAMGLAFVPDSSLQISLDVASEVDRGTSVAIGGSYSPGSGLIGRLGLGTGPATAAFGIGYRIGRFRFDYGGAFRGDAGFLHSIGGGMSW